MSGIYGFRLQGVFDKLRLKGPFEPFAHSNSPDQQTVQQVLTRNASMIWQVLGATLSVYVCSSITCGLAIRC
jgi:hypothetical protein